MEELQGQIVEFIFQNEINSYTIAVLLDENNNEITVTGYLPFINVGDTLKLIGRYVIHQEYGEQFKIETFEKLMPQTLDALERYLSNGSIKGIGPATAKKIIETFGEETIHVFKFEPKKLAQIKGITESKAEEMSNEFIENWELWQIVGYLEKFGVSVSSARKVYKELGTNTIKDIEENPYILVDILQNADFIKIDKMALDLGISKDNYKRIKSGIKYALSKIAINGNSCTLYENLIKYVSDLLNVNITAVEEAVIELNKNQEVYLEERDNGEEWVYLEYYYEAEKNIAEKLITLQNFKNIKKINFFRKELEKAEKNIDIELSEKQKEALKMVNENNVTVITGGPGTGKTTIIKTIIDIYKIHGKKVVLCAPTGRAAKRITETTGEESKTLHRLLEIGKIEDDIKNVNYDVAPIDADVIVVDEISMVDMFLMNYLVRGIYLGTKLVLVGDADQLPSVGPGNVLKDIIDSNKITTIHLDEIFRQAATSKIIQNAHRVNEGQNFIKTEENSEMKKDFFYINENNKEKMLEQVISLCKGRLKNYGNYDFFNNIQVLTPTKKGILGTKELNKILQQELNPPSKSKKEKKSGEIIYRVGDKVMQTKNNYDMYWEKENENGTGIFNGELGIVESINTEEKQLKVRFDDNKVAWYTNADLEQLEHSYSITIHKSQGSEFDVVIIVIPQGYPMLLTRNLLYTSITRAKELLIVISNERTINFMIKNDTNKNRNTGLNYKISKL